MQDRSIVFGVVCAALTVAIWSGFILVSRMGGVSVLTGYDVIALRFGTAAVLILPIWLVRRPVHLWNVRMLMLTLTGGLGYSLFVYTGFKYAPAAHASILMPGALPFTMAFALWVLMGERPSLRRQIGLSVIAVGVSCLAIDTFYHTSSGTWLGDILFFSSSLSWATYTVLVKRWSVTPWQATTGVVLLTALIYLPIYAIFLPKQLAAAQWSMIALQAAYQGVVVVIIAMVLYMQAVVLIGPARTGMVMALVPALSGVAAVPVLGEPLSAWLVVGLIFVSAGAYLGSRA